MNRLSLLAICSLLFMACGGDDGNHNSDAKCGDGVVSTSEQCDDGNTTSGDGCSSTCIKESSPSRCGDGILDVATETCDDGNTASGDGCSATCQTETPPNKCGNGAIDGTEGCDDGNTTAGDGCSQACVVEMDWMCTGAPSQCTMITMATDGTCALPNMIALTGTGTLTGMGSGDTSTATATDQVMQARCDTYPTDDRAADQIWTFTTTDVRDVTITLDAPGSNDDATLRLTTVPCDLTSSVAAEPGDDGCVDAGFSGDGEEMIQSALPAGTYYIVVDGYAVDDVGPYTLSISAAPSTCGDGTVDSLEGCDDHNATVGDGCDARCQIETGYACTGTPSTCHAITCGDGLVDDGEDCDDHNTATGDGCDAACAVEPGYSCSGTPSVCTSLCGNGTLDTGEACDDANMATGDGCDATCHVETGYVCTGEPSTCHATTCGDGVVEGAEACDDHNVATGDGCDGSCQIETDWSCYGAPSTCMFGGTCASPFVLTLTESGGAYTATGSFDNSGGTNEVAAAACDTESSAGGATDQQWSFVNPIAQPVTITFTPTGFDGLVRVMTTACDVTTQVLDDDSGGTSDGCSDQHGTGTAEVLTYDNLPAGTYYIDADGYGATSSGAYTIDIHAGGVVCGDGVVEGAEECDSGGVANDRCTADCHLVFDTTDTEANDDFASAQTVTPVNHIIEGSLAIGDLDVYTFTLTAASVVSVETYTTYASGYTSTSDSTVAHLACPSADTLASIFDGTGDVTDDDTALDSDDDSGDGRCSYVTSATLAPGTYYFVVHEYELDNVISRYLADFTVTPM
jgi:cysteine-rich repeat protein